MQALRINLLDSPATASTFGWLILVLGAIVFAGAWWDHMEATAERAAVQARLAYKAPAQSARVAVAPPAGGSEALKSQQRAVTQLQLPWPQWFGTLETLPGQRVALLALEMQGEGAAVRLSAEARDIRHALAYLTALRASPVVASAELSTHEQLRVGEADVLRFTIDLRWKATP